MSKKGTTEKPASFDELLLTEFLSSERGRSFIKMLRRIDRAGAKGIPTRKACDVIFNARAYGLEMLNLAAGLGLINRVTVRQNPDKKKKAAGRPRKVNYITQAGKELLGQIAS